MMQSLTNRSFMALFVCLLLGGAGCEEGGDPPRAPTPPEQAQPQPQTVRQALAPPQGPVLPASLLELEDHRLIRQKLEGELSVRSDQARTFARNYAVYRGLRRPVHVCLELPVVDSFGTLMATQFILTDVGECDGYEAVIRLMKELRHSAYPESVASTPEELVKQSSQATRTHFFTINVRPYFFRHPVGWAIPGLPVWILEFSETAGFCRERPEPEAILPVSGIPRAFELVRYNCQGRQVLYTHYGDTTLLAHEVRTKHDPLRKFIMWRDRVRQYPSPSERVKFYERVWRDYLTR